MSKETQDPPLVMCVIESSPAASSPAPRVGVLCLASKSLADSLSLGGSASLFGAGRLSRLDSRAFQMHRSQLVASLTWTHNFSCQNPRVFGGKIICPRNRSEVSDEVSFVLAQHISLVLHTRTHTASH